MNVLKYFFEDLYEDYAFKGMTAEEIAKKYGLPCSKVKKWVKPWKVPTEEELRNDYVINKLSIKQMMEKYCVSRKLIVGWMGRYKIPLRHQGARKKGPIPTKEELYKMYRVDNMTMQEMAERFDVSVPTICVWLLNYDIAVKQEDNNVLMSVKELLRKMWFDEGMSMKRIANRFRVPTSTIDYWMLHYDIVPPECSPKLMLYYRLDRAMLYETYVVKDMPTWNIAYDCRVTSEEIRDCAQYYGLVRDRNLHHEMPTSVVLDAEKSNFVDADQEGDPYDGLEGDRYDVKLEDSAIQ